MLQVVYNSSNEEIGKDPQRITKLKRFEDDFDWTGIGFPVSFRAIKKFESRNQISVNILAENKQIYICRKGGYYDRIVNLMLITENNIKHYVVIKSLSRLLHSKNTKNEKKQHFCTNCLQGFTEEFFRDEHVRYCKNNEAVHIEVLHCKPIVEYSNGQYQYKAPFIMYADFESILEPISAPVPNLQTSSTHGVNIHTPSGWCIRSEFAYGEVKDPLRLYRGKDCISRFCEHIIEEAHQLYNSFPEKTMAPLTKSQLREYKHATKCHICFKHFKDEDRKVRDHCHYSGEYRRAAHSLCNLQYKIPSYIPVVFHNLAGYNAHLFIKELAKHGSEMGVIAKNTEDYISFSIKVEAGKYVDKNGEEPSKEIDLRFIDSIKFMSSSLDSLVNNLTRGLGNDKFFSFDECNEHQCELLIRKGIYPCEYMDSWGRFEETNLPPKDSFYSTLPMSGVSETDYEHARKVWREFGINNMREYHDLYLKTDFVLLSNVFEAFGNIYLNNYGLDPAHFYTALGLAWKACLKKTGIRLELLLDPDMLLMFERGIRGGIMQSVHRWAVANNPYMGSEYDPKKPTKYLQYLDANNLYGWAMSQPLPTGGFRWVDVSPNEVNELVSHKDRGYLLEVDVAYPRELHDYHNDLPFTCGRMKINGFEKLVPNLCYKKRYVIHIRALKQVLDHGLVLEKIHRVIEFKQSAWMKEYIDFNTKLRTAAKNDFEKDFYKLMNNSVFGKTMENIRKHRNIKLVNNEEEYLRAVMRPNFKSGTIFGPNLMGCEMGKIKVVMNKPVYLGQAILDFSNLVMYEFHYNYMKHKYDDDKLTLCYMDTNSLIYDIETDDFYKDIADDIESRFDTSGYIPDRPLPVGLNKKVIGLMKDELGGEIMAEFITLRPKMYFYKVGNSESKKCKGIKKCVVRKTISFEDYKNCLFGGD